MKGVIQIENKFRSLEELKEAERASRKRLIMTATLNLFEAQDINDVSMRNIAKEAGISPGLIYQYFDDRDDLFIETFALECQRFVQHFKQVFTDQTRPTTKELSQTFTSYLRERPLLYKMMTYFLLNKHLQNTYSSKIDLIMEDVYLIFDRAFADHKQARLYSQGLFAALTGVLITFNAPSTDEQEQLDQVIELTGHIFSQKN